MRGIVAAKPLLSRPEQQLYGRLVRAFPGHVILAHVALSRLLVVDQSASVADAQPSTNRHRQLVVDFVVCRPDFTVLAVVEVDEGGKPRDAQREKHRRKDQFLQAAGIKVVRVAAADIPNEPALKALVAALPLNFSAAQVMRRAS
jgi:hypothetical protein